MNSWFEVKVRYEKVMENGSQKKVTEPYLVEALSFTEAEARVINEVTPYISGEFSIASIKKNNLSEIFWNEDGDYWFKVKVNFITIDEKTCKEKKKASYIMVQAKDLRDAAKVFDEGMKGTMSDYQIANIKETAIIDVFRYEPKQ